jgi:hypothetical protein
MNCKKRDILLATFDQTDMGAIDIHPFGDRFLAEACCQTVMTHIRAEQFADIHPQLRNWSRIEVLRIIIRAEFRWWPFDSSSGRKPLMPIAEHPSPTIGIRQVCAILAVNPVIMYTMQNESKRRLVP